MPSAAQHLMNEVSGESKCWAGSKSGAEVDELIEALLKHLI